MNIAIVGVGLTGSVILRTILDHKNFSSNDRIFIFEKRDKLGVGLAYQEDTLLKKLNTRADQISLIFESDDHFINWYRENHDPEYDIKDGMISRVIYGDYINEYFSPQYEHPQVEIIHANVEDIIPIENGTPTFKIKTEYEELEEEFSAVFLAIGHQDYQDPYNLKSSDDYINSIYPINEKLSHFSEDDKIAIVGSASVAIDAHHYLLEKFNFKNPLSFLVRNRAFKLSEVYPDKEYTSSFDKDWVIETKKKLGGLIPLKIILEKMNEDFKSYGFNFREFYSWAKDKSIDTQRRVYQEEPQDLAFIQSYLDDLDRNIIDLYNLLPELDRQRLFKLYDDIIEQFSGPPPYESTGKILESADNEKIEVIYGLETIEIDPDGGFTAKIADAKKLHFDKVINATGFNKTIESAFSYSKLMKNLYNRKLIMPDHEGNYVQAKWPELSLLNPRYGEMQNLFMIGAWVATTHYRHNAIDTIMSASKQSAELFMDNVFLELKNN